MPYNKWTETGFPGKQIMNVFLILPTAKGRPGLIAAFQKKIFPSF